MKLKPYKQHYRDEFQPNPHKITNVICPDGIQRDAEVWCYEGKFMGTQGSVEINGERIDGRIYFPAHNLSAIHSLTKPEDIAKFISDKWPEAES